MYEGQGRGWKQLVAEKKAKAAGGTGAGSGVEKRGGGNPCESDDAAEVGH